jgi:hypothetical protein
MKAAVAHKPDVVPAGVMRFLTHNLEDILGRHAGLIPPQPKLELMMLLDALAELRHVGRG